jgi:pilus assembly protein FimV
MLVKSRLLAVFAAVAALLPVVAGALGLGEAHVLSALNQPLNANIEMLAASADDLKDLTVTLAPRELFERQGLERSSFLGNLAFKVSRNAHGEAQVEVRSTQPVTEPFLTFLVAIDWPRGHLVREYTLLVDPPVFETKPSAAAPLVAPATGTRAAAAAGAVERSQTESHTANRPADGRGVEHEVVAGETLSSIVRSQGYSAGADVNRALIATFRANPSAFDGNINRLRRGAIIRVPPQSEWSQLGVDEATDEVHRQVGDWKGEHHDAHLRLIVPKTPPKVVEPASADTGRAEGGKADVVEMRRLLDLKNAELARLQAELAHKTVPAPEAATPPIPTSPAATTAIETAPTGAEPTIAPPEAPVATPAPRKHTSTPVLPVQSPGVLDLLLANAMTLIAAVLAVLALVLLGLKWRARRARGETIEPLESRGLDMASGFTLNGGSADANARLSGAPYGDFEARQRIEVNSARDEHAEFQPPPFNSLTTQAIPHSATPGSPPLDSRLGAESSITLHHMDPLAEADFHIAYGLYAQAADILRLAIDLDPARADLKLKLLEVHFVAGDSAAFVGSVRDLDRDLFSASEWDRVLVMGRQIAPNDALFTGRLDVSVGMDLDLDTGGADAGLDFEIAGGDTVAATSADSLLDLHLDLEKDLLELSATLNPSAQPAPAAIFAAASVDGSRAGDATAEIEIEDLGIPDHVLEGLPSEPPSASDTVIAPRPQETGPGQSVVPDPVGETPQELLAEASRLLANIWPEKSTDLDPSSSATLAMPTQPPAGNGQRSEEIVLSDDWADPQHDTAAVPVMEPSRPDPGASLTGLRMDELNLGDEPLEFDLDDLARALQDDTLAQPGPDRSTFTSDMLATGLHVQPPSMHAGADDIFMDDDVRRSRNNDLDLPELDPVTLSEVGTKLDLARAYLDMGDPDGARAILDEVLSEGSPSQKIEAQRLVETLPG